MGTLEASSGVLGWPRSLFHRFFMDFGAQFGVPGHSLSALFEYAFLIVFRDASGTAFLSILVNVLIDFCDISVTFWRRLGFVIFATLLM